MLLLQSKVYSRRALWLLPTYQLYSLINDFLFPLYRAGLSIGRKVLKIVFWDVPPSCLGSRYQPITWGNFPNIIFKTLRPIDSPALYKILICSAHSMSDSYPCSQVPGRLRCVQRLFVPEEARVRGVLGVGRSRGVEQSRRARPRPRPRRRQRLQIRHPPAAGDQRARGV